MSRAGRARETPVVLTVMTSTNRQTGRWASSPSTTETSSYVLIQRGG